MYTDFRIMNRETWKFPYLGKDLLPFAEKTRAKLEKSETVARNEIAKLIKDVSVRSDSDNIQRLKASIEHDGKCKEQCVVFIHEFTRCPEREFHLAIGDVVFLGIAG